MTESEKLYTCEISKEDENKIIILMNIANGTCLSTVKYNNNSYCMILKNYIKDQKTIDKYLNDLQEETNNDFELKVVKDKTGKKYIYINFDIKNPNISDYYKLLINQIIRYINTRDSFKTVLKYIELKNLLPKISFWKLFFVAHILKPCREYYPYHQPFFDFNRTLVADFQQVKLNLKKERSILNSTTNPILIDNLIKTNLEKIYKKKNLTEFAKQIDLFCNKTKTVKCISSINCKYLTSKKEYKIIKETNEYYYVFNDDYCLKKYKKNRFKII